MTSLPQLQPIFEKLKSGYHLSHEDGLLHGRLMENFQAYADYFGALGLKLVRHERDFYYFEAIERETVSAYLPKVAVFAYVLIDHTASQGQAIEDTIMTATFSLRALPHFSLDSYRAHLRQVGIHEPDDLREVILYLSRIGWAKFVGVEEFRFLRPFYRIFEKCLELSKLSDERAESIASEGTPIWGAGEAANGVITDA
jgi:hypothetical protein